MTDKSLGSDLEVGVGGDLEAGMGQEEAGRPLEAVPDVPPQLLQLRVLLLRHLNKLMFPPSDKKSLIELNTARFHESSTDGMAASRTTPVRVQTTRNVALGRYWGREIEQKIGTWQYRKLYEPGHPH